LNRVINIKVLFLDPLHLLENMFDRKRISATLALTRKPNNVFGLTKWHHFPRKCTDIHM